MTKEKIVATAFCIISMSPWCSSLAGKSHLGVDPSEHVNLVVRQVTDDICNEVLRDNRQFRVFTGVRQLPNFVTNQHFSVPGRTEFMITGISWSINDFNGNDIPLGGWKIGVFAVYPRTESEVFLFNSIKSKDVSGPSIAHDQFLETPIRVVAGRKLCITVRSVQDFFWTAEFNRQTIDMSVRGYFVRRD